MLNPMISHQKNSGILNIFQKRLHDSTLLLGLNRIRLMQYSVNYMKGVNAKAWSEEKFFSRWKPLSPSLSRSLSMTLVRYDVCSVPMKTHSPHYLVI